MCPIDWSFPVLLRIGAKPTWLYSRLALLFTFRIARLRLIFVSSLPFSGFVIPWGGVGLSAPISIGVVPPRTLALCAPCVRLLGRSASSIAVVVRSACVICRRLWSMAGSPFVGLGPFLGISSACCLVAPSCQSSALRLGWRALPPLVLWPLSAHVSSHVFGRAACASGGFIFPLVSISAVVGFPRGRGLHGGLSRGVSWGLAHAPCMLSQSAPGGR